MLTFRDMTLDDRDTVLPMVDAFYRSNAVDHPVPREIVERSFLAAAGNVLLCLFVKLNRC